MPGGNTPCGSVRGHLWHYKYYPGFSLVHSRGRIAGSSLNAALIAELTSIPATIINAAFTVAGIAILYVPVHSAYQRIIK